MSSEPSPSSPDSTAGNINRIQELNRLKRDYANRNTLQVDQLAWSPLIPESHWLDFMIQRFLAASLMSQGWKPQSIEKCRILEVGCGSGRVLQWFYGMGAKSLDGIEMLAKGVEESKHRAPFAVVQQASMDELPYPDAVFDCVVQVLTFSCCLDAGMRLKAASEMRRVLKPGGCILWCDIRPAKGEAAYAQGIGTPALRKLFPGCRIAVQHLGANPQWLGRLTSLFNQGPIRLLLGKRRPITKFPLVAAGIMERCPWLTSYIAAVITCPSTPIG